MNSKIKISYVTHYNSKDILSWSGLGLNIFNCLSKQGFDVNVVDDFEKNFLFLRLKAKTKKAFYRYFLGKNYLPNRNPTLLRHYANYVESQIRCLSPDWVFSPGSRPIAYLNCKQPIAFWTDATFACMIDFYSHMSNLCDESIRQGNAMEAEALGRSRLAIYASEWAAKSAIQDYKISPEKVHVVPFGANITCENDLEDIFRIVDQRSRDVCKLLFLGVDWFRKGGDVAYEVTKQLRNAGLDTELTVVGCEPILPASPAPSFIKSLGFVSKSTPEGRDRINRLLAESHFLILPSRAECFGVVFCEASAFGLPSLATNVGGIPTAIRQGQNGYTFDLDSSPSLYAEKILRLFEHYEDYRALAFSSFSEYQKRLNWKTSGNKIKELLYKSL